MAEYITTASQSVSVGGNVLFNSAVVPGCEMAHRTGSGLFTLKGGKDFILMFSGNVSGATADAEVDLAFAINGEALPYTKMSYVPGTANALGNVSTIVQINVPKCCCYTVSVENIGTTAVTVDTGNLIIREVK